MKVLDVHQKANKVLHLVMLMFLLMAVRIWYLCIIEHDHHKELAKRPQKRTVLEKPFRGTIRDRFNIPLAINRIRYDAAVCYDDLRQLPGIKWIKTTDGKIKTYPRREYIQTLCQLLGKKLSINPQKIEDVIYSQAALFPNTPFVIKENLSEKDYYELKALELRYQGLKTLKNCERYYPQGKVAGDLIGYMGAIDSEKYFSLAHQIQSLKEVLQKHEEGEISLLPKGFLSLQEVRNQLTTLEKKAYHVRDRVGKTGIEAQFDRELRGFVGKSAYEVDTKGHYIRKLPGSQSSMSGKRLILNLSAELQEYAEALLAENEKIREDRFIHTGKNHDSMSPPFIKGGSIVAIIPTTGEIVAMASYPRINPNDFTHGNRQQEIKRWLESPKWIADLWDGKATLSKELYSFKTNTFYFDEKKLSSDAFIDSILSLKGSVRRAFYRIKTLASAHEFASAFYHLLDLSEQPFMSSLVDSLYRNQENHKSTCFSTSENQIELIQSTLDQHKEHVKILKDKIDPFLKSIVYNDDKLLLLDLVELFSNPKAFDEPLLEIFGQDTIVSHRKTSQAFCFIMSHLKKISHEVFQKYEFQKWRDIHFKSYLKDMRHEEKLKKTYQKPFTEYLDKKERELFEVFWNEHHLMLLKDVFDVFDDANESIKSHATLLKEAFEHQLKNPSLDPLLYSSYQILKTKIDQCGVTSFLKLSSTIQSFADLKEPLHGYYPKLTGKKGSQNKQALASSFYPKNGFGFGRSFAYRQSTQIGSIFKIIVAYEALKQRYELNPPTNHYYDLNPLTIIDEIQPSSKKEGQILGIHQDGKRIPRRYKGGTLPRTLVGKLGKIDLQKALERSSNIYFSLLASDVIQDPNDLVLTSLKFGFGHKTGVDLPNEISGALPKDLHENRSGLYSFAIGQHSLIVTPLQTAFMLSSLVNGGEVLKPQILNLSVGVEPESQTFLYEKDTYLFKEYLNQIGLFFPFFLESHPLRPKPFIKLSSKQLYRKLFLPPQIKEFLLEGLHDVVASTTGSARANFIRYLYGNTSAFRNYLKLKTNVVGKSSTAEISYKPTLDREQSSIICNDVWFGAIAFKPQDENNPLSKISFEHPELVVVVYLKFGDYGKEAAPLAGQIITKWRELLKKYQISSPASSE